MNYKETLPDNCPPNHAVDCELLDAWRFIRLLPISDKHFLSFDALERENKKNKPKCDWASCSLYSPRAVAENLAKLQMFRSHKAMAQLAIPVGSGKSISSSGGHIHFWAFDGFSPLDNIVETVKL